MATTTYCEVGIGVLNTQLLNTISSIAYVVRGVLIMWQLLRARSRDVLLWILSIATIGIGVGSALWHGHPHTYTLLVDEFFIYIFTIGVMYGLLRSVTKSHVRIWGIIALMFALEIPFLLEWAPTMNGLLPYGLLALHFAGALYAVIRTHTHARTILLSAFGIFILALGFRTLDMHTCDIWAISTHWLWHVGVAVSCYMAMVGTRQLK